MPRVLADVSRRSTARCCSAAPMPRRSASRRWASALCRPTGAISSARRRRAAANIPMIMSGSSLIRLEEIRAAGPTAWYQAYLPGDVARIEPLLDRVAAGGLQDARDHGRHAGARRTARTTCERAFAPRSAQPAKLAWDGITHPALVARHLRCGPACSTACRTSRTCTPKRGAPILSRATSSARLRQPRSIDLGTPGAHPPALERAARDQGHPVRRRRERRERPRRRRHHGVEPRRPPARRRGGAAARAARRSSTPRAA